MKRPDGLGANASSAPPGWGLIAVGLSAAVHTLRRQSRLHRAQKRASRQHHGPPPKQILRRAPTAQRVKQDRVPWRPFPAPPFEGAATGLPLRARDDGLEPVSKA